MDDDVGLWRNDFARCRIDGGLLQKRTAEFGKRIEMPIHHPSETSHESRAHAAWSGRRVTRNAGYVVEDGTESALCGVLAGEFLQAFIEVGSFVGGEVTQRIAQIGSCARHVDDGRIRTMTRRSALLVI